MHVDGFPVDRVEVSWLANKGLDGEMSDGGLEGDDDTLHPCKRSPTTISSRTKLRKRQMTKIREVGDVVG